MGRIVLERISKKPLYNKEWITATDIKDFFRCPFMLWLVNTKQYTKQELMTAVGEKLVDDGVMHEEKVFEKFNFEETEESIEELIKKKAPVREPFLMDEQQKFCSRPDIIAPVTMVPDIISKMHLEPVYVDSLDIRLPSKREKFEKFKMKIPKSYLKNKNYVTLDIKNHMFSTIADEFQVIFQSLCLARYIGCIPKYSFILLNTGDFEVVKIDQDKINKVNEVIEKIKRIRFEGATIYKTGSCKSCGAYNELCLPILRKKGSTSLVNGIGEVFCRNLEKIGILDIQTLAKQDFLILHQKLVQCRDKILNRSEDNVKRWIVNARAIVTKKPIVHNVISLPRKEMEVFLDLEYDNFSGDVWCYGVATKEKDIIKFHQFLVEPKKSTKKDISQKFYELIEKLDDKKTVIYTWSGTSADLPRLRSNIDVKSYQKIEKLHFDLYREIIKCISLPTFEYGLKEISKLVGFNYKYEMNGIEANDLYYNYLASGKKSYRRKILTYNKDDLKALIAVKEASDKMFKCKLYI